MQALLDNCIWLNLANKKSNGKKKDLVRGFFRKSMTLLDDKLRVMSINVS